MSKRDKLYTQRTNMEYLINQGFLARRALNDIETHVHAIIIDMVIRMGNPLIDRRMLIEGQNVHVENVDYLGLITSAGRIHYSGLDIYELFDIFDVLIDKWHRSEAIREKEE